MLIYCRSTVNTVPFSSLAGGKHQEVKRLLITASGGPFRGKSKAEAKCDFRTVFEASKLEYGQKNNC